MHRAVISDGEQYGQAIITSEVASLIASDAIKVNQLVVLKEYIINNVGGKTNLAIIMQMAPVPVEEGAELTKIGGARGVGMPCRSAE